MIGILGGPLLAASIGLSGLFYVLAALAFSAMVLAAISFPKKNKSADKQPAMAFKPILMHGELRPIFIAAFVLSFTLNLFFFTYPLSWADIGLDRAELWKVYLIIFLPSALLVFPYMRRAERLGRFRMPIMIGWLTAMTGYAVYLVGAQSDLLLYVSGAAFFFGYSLFQPLLPTFLTEANSPGGPRHSHRCLYLLWLHRLIARRHTRRGADPCLSSLPEFLGVVLLVLWYFSGLPTAPENAA